MEDLLNKLEAHGKKFTTREMPLWLSMVIFVALVAIGVGVFIYFRLFSINYTFQLAGYQGQTTLHYGPIPALENADYFSKIKNQLVNEKAHFIEADLSSMILRVHKDGKVIKEVPILTKGREGSWWETPAGIYKIETKASNHFSSFGQVYQPWSMAFQGNFFIHGWPYYPDGREVAGSYSGGCIRLSTEHSKEVYQLVAVGTPVLVYEKDFFQDSFTYNLEPSSVTADELLVADLSSDSVLFAKNVNATTSIASITKLVTSLVAAEYINLDNIVTINQSMLASTSQPRLKVGQTISVYDLLFPLLMESSNEAALAISTQTGQSRFIDLMNKKATSLGMKNSHFADPAGVSPNNRSNAHDLFLLAKYIYNNRSFVFKMSAGAVGANAYGTPYYKNLNNFNIVPGVSDQFVGGKIGKSSAAKETYLGVFHVNVRGEKRPIVVILLGSSDVYGDTAALLRQIHATYQ